MNFALVIFVVILTLCSGERPNVVIIVADDLGWNDVSFHGSNQIPTSNIDALAYSGIILQNYYTLPLCSPSRSALMTGIHPIRTGMYHDVIWSAQPFGLPLGIKILPQYLKDDGYKTHAVGKWHLGFCKSDYTPLRRGFDSFFGFYSEKEDYFSHVLAEDVQLSKTNKKTRFQGLDFREGADPASNYWGQYSTDLFTSKAVDIIKRHNTSSPLFLYLAHQAVHVSSGKTYLQAPVEDITKFSDILDIRRRVYAAMVKKLDDSVGEIVAMLAIRRMLDNTIIIFTTDNGGPANGFNHNMASNWPLRGVKFTLWEGGVRGSAFIWSKSLPSSKASNSLMHIQDWLPTILAAVNSTSGYSNLDGHNMWPVLKGEKPFEYDELLLNKDPIYSTAALRKGDWKLIQGHMFHGVWDDWYGPSGRHSIRPYNVQNVMRSPVAQSFVLNNIPFPSVDTILNLRQNVTLTCPTVADAKKCGVKEDSCLFNIREDPCELNNMSSKKRLLMRQLINITDQYKPVRPLNKPDDPKANPILWNNVWSPWMDSTSH